MVREQSKERRRLKPSNQGEREVGKWGGGSNRKEKGEREGGETK
jgi:hypothetical protein